MKYIVILLLLFFIWQESKSQMRREIENEKKNRCVNCSTVNKL